MLHLWLSWWLYLCCCADRCAGCITDCCACCCVYHDTEYSTDCRTGCCTDYSVVYYTGRCTGQHHPMLARAQKKLRSTTIPMSELDWGDR